MKKLIVFLLALCLLASLAACHRDDPNAGETTEAPPNSSETTHGGKAPNDEPDEEFFISYSCSIWPANCEKDFGKYLLPEGPVQLTVTAGNGHDRADPFYLMILADGLPAEFSVEGEKYLSYPMELTKTEMTFTVELEPEFSLNLGRLDAFILYDGDPLAFTAPPVFTYRFAVEGEPLEPDTLQPTEVWYGGSYSGGVCDAWLYSADDKVIRQQIVTIREGEDVWFDALASEEGLYRTVLIINGEPLSFTLDGKEYSWLDWQTDGKEKLHLSVTLPEIPDNSRFYAIFTPIAEEDIRRESQLSQSSLINETLVAGE